jgi:carbonic anhydrase/acetyltransferase-like protein (isoleucine patch superfamily)
LFVLANVGRQVVLTSGCIIGAACSVTNNEDIEENSVIYGANCERRVQKERPPVSNFIQVFSTVIFFVTVCNKIQSRYLKVIQV